MCIRDRRDTQVLEDETVAEIDAKIEAFKKEFRTSEGQSLNEQFDSIDEEDIHQEQLVVKKK